ncbi:MAG TPA: hypothetical protein VF365_05765 [Candidatus Limnocylindria bacterium]
MLVIQALKGFRRLPALMVAGLLAMAIGGLMDVAVHVAPATHDHDAVGASEHLAHVVGIAGMSLVLAGLVMHGARRHHRPRAALHGGLDTNAHR